MPMFVVKTGNGQRDIMGDHTIHTSMVFEFHDQLGFFFS